MRGFKVHKDTPPNKRALLRQMREHNFLALVNSKDRVRQTWTALQEKVKKQLAMFDSITFSDSLPVDDVTLHQKLIRLEPSKTSFTDQC